MGLPSIFVFMSTSDDKRGGSMGGVAVEVTSMVVDMILTFEVVAIVRKWR